MITYGEFIPGDTVSIKHNGKSLCYIRSILLQFWNASSGKNYGFYKLPFPHTLYLEINSKNILKKSKNNLFELIPATTYTTHDRGEIIVYKLESKSYNFGKKKKRKTTKKKRKN